MSLTKILSTNSPLNEFERSLALGEVTSLSRAVKWNSLKLQHLVELEDEVCRCGIDGGQSTSAAIHNLHYWEKQYGIAESEHCPRWLCNG